MELVYATPEIIEKAFPERPNQTIRAILAIDQGNVLGIAGVYRQDANLVMFAQLSDELLTQKRTIVRGIRLLKKMAARVRMPVVALADPEIDGSEKLLEHMGFKPAHGRIYTWHS